MDMKATSAGSSRWIGRVAVWTALALLPGVALGWFAVCAPLVAPAARVELPGAVVLGADGTVLQRDASAGLRIPVAIEAIAPIAREATIAAEDQRFLHHPGVDPIAVLRALMHLPGQRSGASTITQQLARRLYLQDDTSPGIIRKAHEMLLALQISGRESKDEVLGAYLNEVYYGRGAYGIEAAARVYFGISAANLDLPRAAYLAGLPQLPSVYDPASDPATATARQRYVLGRLADDGKISAAQVAVAGNEPLTILPPLAQPIAPHFVQYALDELAQVRPDLANRPGLVIETTLDPGLQQEAERLVNVHLEELTDRHVTNAAVVSLDPRDGRILAMVGSAGFGDEAHQGQVNLALAERQPGSALKPFLYAAAFEHGYTPATMLLDVPSTFDTPQGPYSPLDYDRRFHGPVSLRTALASSFNIPAVRTIDQLGIDTFLEVAHRVGLQTLNAAETYGLALTLGGGEVRLLDLTSAYGAIATEGLLTPPYAVARVLDTSGHVLYEHQTSDPARVLQPEHAYLLADILSDSDARIPGFGQVTPLDLPFKAGVKTGTTTGFRDNWTIGFTPGLVTGVWVGNADGSPMQDVSGVDGAGPIWRDVMIAAVAGRDPGWLERPPGIVESTVCDPTGALPGPDCPSPRTELFAAGTVPRSIEHYYTRLSDGSLAVNPPPDAVAWALDSGLPLAAAGVGAGLAAAVRIVQPVAGAVLFLSPELQAQEVVLRATVPPGTASVTFAVDGASSGPVPGPDAQVTWPLKPGTHRVDVSALLPDGGIATANSTYEVRIR
jgi:penicillin-binding protein 1C